MLPAGSLKAFTKYLKTQLSKGKRPIACSQACFAVDRGLSPDEGANASTAAFKKYLYQDLDLPVVKTTAKFQEAADDEMLVL